MNNQTELIQWGINSLLSKGFKLVHSPEVAVKTPWSTVIKFSTLNGCFYLKQTPGDLFIETTIIKTIQKNMSNSHTPTILFENNDINCFLMNSCGEYSLRTKFKGTIDIDLLVEGLHYYLKILRSFERELNVLEKIGIPNWGLNHIPQLFVELLEKKALLADEGVTPNELEKLRNLVLTIKTTCEFLSEQTVKETLVNCDFNENNLIIDEKTQKISIIDWGESVITHPFFSIASHLQSLSRRYKLDLEGALLKKIKYRCLSCWSDVANMRELDIIYQNILKIHPIFCSLSIYRLQTATDNKSKEMQNWFIAGFFKTLLNIDKGPDTARNDI